MIQVTTDEEAEETSSSSDDTTDGSDPESAPEDEDEDEDEEIEVVVTIPGDEQEPGSDSSTDAEGGVIINTGDGNTPITVNPGINDGDLIRVIGTVDVFHIKLIPDPNTGQVVRQYKRLILNPEIFNSYGHFSWTSVKNVTQTVVDSYTDTMVVRERYGSGATRLYMLFATEADTGVKSHIALSAEEFTQAGGDLSAVYDINHIEASEDFYRTINPISTVEQLRRILSSA